MEVQALFLLERPSDPQIETFIASQHHLAFSYPDVGATRQVPPAGYRVDHNRVQLGEGSRIYAEGCERLANWKHFDLGWIDLKPAGARIAVGTTVAVLAQHIRFWSLNACRIVYVIEEEDSVWKFGFAYGTLPDHAETGEERFTIEWHRGDDSVWYDILAFSRPNNFAVKLGYPVTRMFQRRFARDSLRRMAESLG